MAEQATRSRNEQIHFLVISLESFASAQGSTTLAQQTLERMGGRFIQHELKSQNTEELVCASLAKMVPPEQLFDGALPQQDDLLSLAMRLWGQREDHRYSQDWVRKTVVQGAFPLHPLATYCLPRVNAILAQNERTMFSFLWDTDNGLNGFIQRSEAEPSVAGCLPTMPLASLFAYFERNLREKRSDLMLAYDQARAKLGPDLPASGLESPILQALVLLNVVPDPNLRCNQELLRHAVGIAAAEESNLDSALSQLEQALVLYRDQSGNHCLVLPGHANPLELKHLIEQRARDSQVAGLELLNTLHPLDPVCADSYNAQRGTARQLAAQFIDSSGMSSPATLANDLGRNDGLVWYMVAASEQELLTVRAAALQLTRDNDGLAIAIPREPTELVMRFRRKRALEAIRSGPDYQTSDFQALLIDTGLVGRDYVKAFGEARRYFDSPGNFDWYRGGRTVDVRTSQHLELLATRMMKEIYPKTPPHQTSQHLRSSGGSKNLRDAVDCILQAPFPMPPATRGKKSARDAILRDGAAVMGLVATKGKEQGYEMFDVVMPGKSTPFSREIWLLMEDHFQKGLSWQAIVDALVSSPYGLYLSVLQLFIAAFYRYNRDCLETYEAESLKPISLTSAIVELLVQTPEKYVFRFQPLGDTQRLYLRGIVERALYPERHLPDLGSSAAALRNRTAQALQIWVGQTPGVARIARHATAEELASVLTDESPDAIRVAVALLNAAQQASIPATAAVLQEGLPAELGLPASAQEWTVEQVDHALALLESACSALQRFPHAFKAQMAWRVGQLFGLESPAANWNDTLAAAMDWRRTVGKIRALDLTASTARDLLHVLDDRPSTFEHAFLNALPSRMQLLTFDGWASFNIPEEYVRRLAEAKATVERTAQDLAQRPPQPTAPAQRPVPPVPRIPLVLPPKTPPSVPPEPPALVVKPPVETVSEAVRRALAQIQPILEGLAPSECQELLRVLLQRYGRHD